MKDKHKVTQDLVNKKDKEKFRTGPCFSASFQDIPPANPAAGPETKRKKKKKGKIVEASFIEFNKLG